MSKETYTVYRAGPETGYKMPNYRKYSDIDRMIKRNGGYREPEPDVFTDADMDEISRGINARRAGNEWKREHPIQGFLGLKMTTMSWIGLFIILFGAYTYLKYGTLMTLKRDVDPKFSLTRWMAG